MAYEKRLCILKQTKKGFTADGGALSGAMYAERLGTELTLTPKLTGAAPLSEGRYVFAVYVGGTTYCIEARGNTPITVSEAPPLREGFCVLFCYLRNGEAEPVAFGTTGSAPKDYAFLLQAVEKEGEKKKRTPPAVPLSPFEQPVPVGPQAPHAPAPPLPRRFPEEEEEPFRDSLAAHYDDEAISEENYFLSAGDENENAAALYPPQKEEVGDNAPRNVENGSVPPLLKPNGKLTYYNRVRARLEKAMKAPRDTRLNSAFPHSEWVQSQGGLLGIIYREGIPRYLCVAVKKEQSLPPEVRDKAQFVPLHDFTESDGFFVVFQDADTGEYATLSIS